MCKTECGRPRPPRPRVTSSCFFCLLQQEDEEHGLPRPQSQQPDSNLVQREDDDESFPPHPADKEVGSDKKVGILSNHSELGETITVRTAWNHASSCLHSVLDISTRQLLTPMPSLQLPATITLNDTGWKWVCFSICPW